MSGRLSPLDEEHRRLGAKLVDFGGWEMPLSYPDGTITEHLACRNEAVVFDVSHLGTVRVTGPDAFARLQSSLTNDLGKIGPGKAQYTHLLDDSGSVLDDIIVWWVSEDRFDVMPNASNTSRVVDAIGGADVTSERAVMAVQGPGALERAGSVLQGASEIARNSVTQLTFRDTPCTVAGTGYTGEPGLEIAAPVAVAGPLWEELLDAGVKPAGLGARDTLRLEAGLPLHGHELGPGITPLQAGLSWVVAWDKGDFPGRAALEEERARGVGRRLRGFVTDGRQPPRQGSAVLVDGEEVGVITSGNYSPVLGRGIALGFVAPVVAIDAAVEIDVRGRRLAARVVRPPFVSKRGS